MEQFFSIIEASPLFEGIASWDLRGMLSCLNARVQDMKKGQFLFREGDPAGFVGIVLEGAVQIVREDYYGNRSIMGYVGRGDLFGESYAFSGSNVLPISVQADADGKVLLMDSRRISSCCSNACDFHNQMIANLLRLVSDKNLMLHQKLLVTSRKTTREKLMAYLLQQAKAVGNNTFTIPFDRQELADYLEVDRSGLSAEISKLRNDGILESEKSTFRLLREMDRGN